MSFFYQDSRDVMVTLNGFKMYGEDSYGCEWHTSFSGISGIFDGAGSTISTSDKAWSDGWYSNIPTYTGRNISIEGYIYGACTENIILSWDYFKSKFLIDSQTLTVQLGSISRQCTVMQASSEPLLEWQGLNLIKFSIELVSLDAYMYGTDLISGTTKLPSSTGGMSFDYHFESPGQYENVQVEYEETGGWTTVEQLVGYEESTWRFNEEVTTGFVRLENPGTANAPVDIRIDGPVINPRVYHDNTGRTMQFTTQLGASHYITADGDTHEIKVDGSANNAKGIVTTREWSYAVPGENIWRFSAAEWNDEATLTVSFYAAYL